MVISVNLLGLGTASRGVGHPLGTVEGDLAEVGSEEAPREDAYGAHVADGADDGTARNLVKERVGEGDGVRIGRCGSGGEGLQVSGRGRGGSGRTGELEVSAR